MKVARTESLKMGGPLGGIIGPMAGTGIAGYSGDNGNATTAMLNGPRGGVYDNGGNFYLSDSGNHRIRKITPAGIITSIAGTGVPGLGGDGGPATNARLNGPTALAIDSDQNLYVADTGNHLIRKITPAGIISTFMGAVGSSTHWVTLSGPRGIALDRYQRLYVADTGNRRIISTNPAGLGASGYTYIMCGVGGWIANSPGDMIAPVAVSVGYATYEGQVTILIADAGKRIVYRCGIGAAWFSYEPIVGGGVSAINDGALATDVVLTAPSGVFVDPSFNGDFYFVDQDARRLFYVSKNVLRIVAGSGASDPVGDGGLATDAGLSSPSAFARDSMGNFAIVDTGHNMVRKVSF